MEIVHYRSHLTGCGEQAGAIRGCWLQVVSAPEASTQQIYSLSKMFYRTTGSRGGGFDVVMRFSKIGSTACSCRLTRMFVGITAANIISQMIVGFNVFLGLYFSIFLIFFLIHICVHLGWLKLICCWFSLGKLWNLQNYSVSNFEMYKWK